MRSAPPAHEFLSPFPTTKPSTVLGRPKATPRGAHTRDLGPPCARRTSEAVGTKGVLLRSPRLRRVEQRASIMAQRMGLSA